MLGKHGETLVVDWGLAKELNRPDGTPDPARETTWIPVTRNGGPTRTGDTPGTPAYMSPEQAVGQPDRVTKASDMYGLGAILYCLLTGRPPVEGTSLEEVLYKVSQGVFPRPRDVKRSIAPALEAICLKAMALKPEEPLRLAEGPGR